MVVTSLAAGVYGTTSAATTALPMISLFPRIESVFLKESEPASLDQTETAMSRDIAVSQPIGKSGRVIYYELGMARSGEKQERRDFLNRPPDVLLKALGNLQAHISIRARQMTNCLSLPTIMFQLRNAAISTLTRKSSARNGID